MKTITTNELDLLKAHLIKKPFKYQEVFLEVLDHYASAYEHSDDSLEETIAKIDHVFPNERIEDINSRYIKDLTRQMRKAHFTLFTNYFRWPQLVTSLLTIALFVVAAPLIHEVKSIKVAMIIVFGLAPLILFVYATLKSFELRRRLPGKLKNGHYQVLVVSSLLIFNYLQINSFYRLFTGSENANILDVSPYLTAGILLVGLILCSTTLQLYFTKVKPNMV